MADAREASCGRFAVALVVGGLALAVVLWGLATQVVLDHYRDDRQSHAISAAEFDSVTPGIPEAAAKARFGEPEEVAVEEAEGGAQLSCISYKEQGAPLLRERTFRLCFGQSGLALKDFAPITDPADFTVGETAGGS